jgi:hypothetical protein
LSEAAIPSSYAQVALPYLYFFLLIITGFFLGYFLAKKVKLKLILIGSTFYWITTLVYLITSNDTVSRTLPYENPFLYYSYGILFWSIFFVLSLNITYIVTRAYKHLSSKKDNQGKMKNENCEK